MCGGVTRMRVSDLMAAIDTQPGADFKVTADTLGITGVEFHALAADWELGRGWEGFEFVRVLATTDGRASNGRIAQVLLRRTNRRRA
jgi:hypothetical protein